MRKLVLLFLIVGQLTYASDDFWGATGHRTVGEVASAHLKGSTKRKLKKLLNGQSLAVVSTYADDIKSDERFKGFSPWHYVNFSSGKKYGEEPISEYGDLVKAIEKCKEIISSDEASQDDKVFYLKLLVHFIGDLHQPLHVGRGEDKGGNDIQIRWFNEGSNMHRLWDSDMIDFYGMSYTELAANLPTVSKAQLQAIEQGTLLDWVYDSQELAQKVYASAQSGDKLGYRYMYDHFDEVKMQLLKGGVRLAKVLNEIL